MSKSLIIFGTGDIAELAYYYFSTDSEYQTAAFTVDADYLRETTFCGLPVIPFDSVADHYPPDLYQMFIALSYSNLNEVRKRKYLDARMMGYRLAKYISTRATVLNGGRIGDNCFVLESNTIQPFVTIGNNVTLWSGNHVGHHATIHDHVFIASHVVISGRVEIGESSFIGVNATLRDHIKVGERCIIGAGALLLEDVQAEGVYKGSVTKRAAVESSKIKKI